MDDSRKQTSLEIDKYTIKIDLYIQFGPNKVSIMIVISNSSQYVSHDEQRWGRNAVIGGVALRCSALQITRKSLWQIHYNALKNSVILGNKAPICQHPENALQYGYVVWFSMCNFILHVWFDVAKA